MFYTYPEHIVPTITTNMVAIRDDELGGRRDGKRMSANLGSFAHVHLGQMPMDGWATEKWFQVHIA